MLALVLALGATPLAVYADEVQTGISTVSEDTEEKDKDIAKPVFQYHHRAYF